jgi:hypothetical protein
LPEHDFGRPAPVPFPWTVQAGTRTLKISTMEIDCGAYNADPETLMVWFHGEAREFPQEREHTVSGSLCCRVVPVGKLDTTGTQ